MRFYQMNGCGNRFAIFDGRERPFRASAEDIKRIATSHHSGRYDQIIGMESSIRGDVFMRIWNSDGSEVDACGNASRCVASILLEEEETEGIKIETEAGLLAAKRGEGDLITVDMGSPLLNWEEIPLAEKMDTRGVDVKIGPMDAPYLSRPACVNMGNPHATFFVEDVDSYDIPAIGPLVEWHPLFPEGVNVGFAQILTPEAIRLRVWERGAGLTLACGTGACATLVNAVRLNKTERRARVVLDGGELIIEWREADDRILMTGPVELEASGEL